jgi:outer membrane lipoprotein LolB
MRRRGLLTGLLAATLLGAACADKTRATGTNGKENGFASGTLQTYWAGRISLQIQSEPTQAFYASFELKGSAESGELALISPLGNILGLMRWTPAGAVLEQGRSIQRFASTDELLAQATGTAVPVPALFDWLAGKDTSAPGWLVDLSQRGSGRITAKRTSPAPQADLRIILDQ